MRSASFVIVAVVAALAVVGVTSAAPKWYQLTSYTFAQYVKDFHKIYPVGSVEYVKRQKIFEEKLAHFIDFNAGDHSYKKGVNHLTDLSPAELLALGGRVPDSMVKQPEPTAIFTSGVGVEVPDSLDYRNTSTTNGTVILTAVKDQGQCGSCWAHASTESVETHYALATGELYVLSQQQMVSCFENTQSCGGTGGCNGATAQLGWQYLQQAGGQTEEWMYGYTSGFGDSGECQMNSNFTQFVQLNGYTQVERNAESAVVQALNTYGPLAISVDASSWSDYETGIFSGCNYANNISIDHAVQLIGYGFDAKLNHSYWLVRNSWSAGWGEHGYIRLLRKPGNEDCGWNMDWNTNGGGCPGGPNVIWVCGECGLLYDTAFPNIGYSPAVSKSNAGVIAGAVVGGVVGAAIVGFLIHKFVLSSASRAETGHLLDKADGDYKPMNQQRV